MFWIVILLIFPGFGFLLYFLWGSSGSKVRWKRKMKEVEGRMKCRLTQDAETEAKFFDLHPVKRQIAKYLIRDGYPIYQNTAVKYFGCGEAMEPAYMEDLRRAEKFIFMEYFIVYNGEWWKEISAILIQKAQAGVDVRLIIDDFGCLMMNVRSLKKELIDKGIQITSFAPIQDRITSFAFNYRDHQKIMIVDGNVAYTGGINLADEYVNRMERFGYWKDAAIRLEGDAVWSMTNIFLQMWEDCNSSRENDYDYYRPDKNSFSWMKNIGMDGAVANANLPSGFVQPYAGGPHRDPGNPSEGVYARMISKARNYIYITTPYLVLNSRMQDLLILAARSEVDVRILVPKIYDKWYVYMVNVSCYGKLLESGVRVFEYTPGFIHAKNMVADDSSAICGTVNFDYRSLYLHYENAVFFTDNQAVLDLKEDFLQAQAKSEEIFYEDWKKRPWYKKILQSIMKLFSPLL